MKKPDICCIGHITLDKIITPKLEAYMPGGTAFYVAHALEGLDHSGFRLLTSVGETEMDAVEDIRAKGIDVDVIPSKKSVFLKTSMARISTTARSESLPRPIRLRSIIFAM